MESSENTLTDLKMVSSNWRKFCLLMWKNWLIEWRNKLKLVSQIMVPIFLCLILVFLRSMTKPTYFRNPTRYNPLPVDSFNYLRNLSNVLLTIGYYPKNKFTNKLMILSMRSVNFTSFPTGFDNVTELEENVFKRNLIAGVIFNMGSYNGTSEVYPKHLSYTLRFPPELRFNASSLRIWPINTRYPTVIFSGPRNLEDSDGGAPGAYVREGFIALQHAISTSYIKVAMNKNILLPNVMLQRYPYPGFIVDRFLDHQSVLMPLIFVACFGIPASYFIKNLALEKEKKQKEIMNIMGLDNSLHFIAWFLKSLILLTLTSLLIVGLIKIPWKPGAAILPHSHWTVVAICFLVYSISVIGFCFMVSTFFSKATTAYSIGSLIYSLAFIPIILFFSDATTVSTLGQKIGFSFLMNSAFGFALQLILNLERAEEGLQWKHIFESDLVADLLPFGFYLVMMILDTILYLLVASYCSRVFPGEYGVPEPWYFLCTSKFWCGKEFDSCITDDENVVNLLLNKQSFEEEPCEKYAGIQIRNLGKEYNTNKMAVKNFTMNLYEDQITALLGHNGAGKSTLIAMLTGMFTPSSGTAIINGSDIRTNMRGVRLSLGYCPQENVLFDHMTVSEHLQFYCAMKGLDSEESEANIFKYLNTMELDDKKDDLPCTLSGGMQRKLCLAIALCGTSKIVFCDEPTSGMDPTARRQVWDLLQREKIGRTILLSTHFMDEADVLGDRIAIMANGTLQACGSPFFLKKTFGMGYRLTCEKGNQCKVVSVNNLLQKYIPGIYVDTNTASELSYKLPEEHVPQFENILSDLEENCNDLNINGFGISPTTLEEVFLRIIIKQQSSAIKTASDLDNDHEQLDLANLPTSKHKHGLVSRSFLASLNLIRMQFQAMLSKKFIYSKRNWLTLLINTLIPLIFLLIAVINTEVDTKDLEFIPLRMNIDSYPKTVSIVEFNPNNIEQNSTNMQILAQYESFIRSFGSEQKIEKIHGNIQNHILQLAKTNLLKVNSEYLIGATIGPKNLIAWFNNQAYHTASVSLNHLHNAILKVYADPMYSIEVINEPFPLSVQYKTHNLAVVSNFGISFVYNVCFAFSFLGAYYSIFSIKERVTKSKLLQFICGAKKIIFWLSTFIFDLGIYLTVATIGIFIIATSFNENLAGLTGIGTLYAIFILFGFAILPFVYLLSLLFSEVSNGYSSVWLISYISGAICFVVVIALDLAYYPDGSNTCAGYLRMFPFFNLGNSIINLVSRNSLSRICDENPTCDSNILIWKDKAINDGLLGLSINFFVYFLLLFLAEYKVLNKLGILIYGQFKSLKLPKDPDYGFDDDVKDEKRLVCNIPNEKIKSHSLIMRNATKFYGNFLAVNQISLAIESSECFGLLGINGAGKTSTFKMLTGDEWISFGEIYINGVDIRSNVSKIYKKIGYCPQFDALLEDFTGRETLRMYCQLRGVQPTKIENLCQHLAKSLGFFDCIDKMVRSYSGGSKRKLSTALALIGYPQVIFLDEPTTGMDPKSRRDLWNVICKIRDAGRTVILTSHNMEECEALCTRVAIMVNGDFVCLGSTQHLKNKFSKGLVISIKIKSRESDTLNGTTSFETHTPEILSMANLNSNVLKVKEFITDSFPNATLKDEHKDFLVYFVPTEGVKWSKIFGIMESNKYELNIEDYSISQTTLEQIFLDFVKYQRELMK